MPEARRHEPESLTQLRLYGSTFGREIGYRLLRMTDNARRIGIYGFDAMIIFGPIGNLVPLALRAVGKAA